MKWLINSNVYWILLLITIIGEFAVPKILAYFYTEYNSTTMVMSALGNPKSPVKFAYNLWLIWLGVILLFTAIIFFLSLKSKFPICLM